MSVELKQMYRTAVSEDFPSEITLSFGDRQIHYYKVVWPDGEGEAGLRYGENPHQPGAFYAPRARNTVMGALSWVKLGKGGPSWINVGDMEHALRILRYLDRPAAVIMKHLNPCGVAVQVGDESLTEVFRKARRSDERASFGGVVAFNRVVDGDMATEILQHYVEVIVAPGYTEAAMAQLAEKRDLRVALVTGLETLPKFVGDDAPFDLKVLTDGSLLVQQPYLTKIRSVNDFMLLPEVQTPAGTVRGEHIPTEAQMDDLLLAWYVNTGVRSNGVVFVKDGRTLAVGTGEQERVGAVEQAIAKAIHKGHDLSGAVVSSDAFFPFRDAIDTLAAARVKAIIQPGGSMRDAEVIQACNEHGIAMVFTGERCFGHF